ncbi:MAG: hypothetical protein KF700_09460 [Hyphomonadaceae bacterium]|nr:hypothetical protein [Hyphomonadaceae bacterium]
MAEKQSGSATPWIAFLVGVVLVAIVAAGFIATQSPPQEQARLEINVPDIAPPKIDLPEPPPAPTLPPAAEPAPAQ